jgi:hypothetical protein
VKITVERKDAVFRRSVRAIGAKGPLHTCAWRFGTKSGPLAKTGKGATHSLARGSFRGHVVITAGRALSLRGFAPSRMCRCSLALAAFEAPRHTRAAIALIVSVVSRLSRAPISSLSGSFLHRLFKSASFQPSRLSSSATIRSALGCALPWRSSPE